jgi:MFS family permease
MKAPSDLGQGGNAEWLNDVGVRIRECEVSTRRAQKRAMIWGGIALVLAAVGLALLVNRLSSDPSNGKYGEAGVTLLMPVTLQWVTLYAAICLSVIAVSLWARDKGSHRSSGSSTPDWVVWLVCAILVAAFAGVLRMLTGSDPSHAFRIGHGSLGTAFVATALGLFMISLYYSRKVRRHEQDMNDLRFEQDLLRHAVKPFQTRAEKLLSVNQIQLRRYYELNLEQAKGVFLVGIGCIAAGLIVVGVTFWFISTLGDQQTQAIVAVVGAVGAILTNFVAFMYLKIQSSIGESLTTFYKQLASMHDLFFANVLAASVESEDKRTETLVRLANAIAERRVTDVAEPAKVP